jgi:hypothetical protein
VLGEAIDARTVVAGAVIIFAVALIVTARGRMRRPSDAASEHRDIAASSIRPTPAPAPRSASTR